MSDDQLSEIFKRGVPRPSEGAWADDARRRAGRRRVAVGGAAVLAAAALVVPFALQMGDDGGDTAVPAPLTESSEVAEGAQGSRVAACEGAVESAVDELPGEAERLWLCDEPGDIGFARTGPQEPLTQGVDQALAAFHGLPEADPNQACTMEYGLTYVVVAESADGTMTPVTGGLHGCRTVGNRSGADEFLDELAGLWAEQRAAAPAPEQALSADELCAAAGSILPTSIQDAAQGALCGVNLDPQAAVEGEALPQNLLERVRDGFDNNAVEGTLGEWEPVARMVLANPWGDSVGLSRFPSGAYSTGNQIWRPDDGLAAELDALLSPAEPTQPSTREPVDCSHISDAVATGPARIDAAVDSVQICVESPEGGPRWTGPASGLYEPVFVARAVDSFNALPVLEAECLSEPRADVFVAFTNAGKTVAAFQLTTCGPQAGGVTKDGPGFLDELYELTREQAGPQGAGMHFGAQEFCPQLDSLVPFDPTTADLAQAVACVGPEAELPVDLPPELVALLDDDLSAVAQPDGWQPEGGTLVLANSYGEPMTLVRGADGSFGWGTADSSQVWEPSGELREQLDRIFGL